MLYSLPSSYRSLLPSAIIEFEGLKDFSASDGSNLAGDTKLALLEDVGSDTSAVELVRGMYSPDLESVSN